MRERESTSTIVHEALSKIPAIAHQFWTAATVERLQLSNAE
jgi:hypothetical protein